jgi:two-component system chemotaxis sensor kinase CheA
VVVMQVGDTRFGLIVDQVFDTEEIVVKPLSKRLGSVTQYSGATILGDGAVIMILDPNGVAKSVAGIEGQMRRTAHEEMAKAAGGEKMSLLLFSAGGPEPRACPLSLVTRLEDLDAAKFETTQRGPVVQYRGRLMPLVHAAGVQALKREGRQSVLVFSQGDSVIGLAVDAILDIVEDTLDIELGDTMPGVLGTAVLKGRSTEVIDVGWFLNQADASWAAAASQTGPRTRRQRVALIDAHPFFRNMLAPLVKAAGYDVTIAESFDELQGRLGAGDRFDVVLADADQPDRTGDLAAVLAQGEGAAVIPLSSRADGQATAIGPSVPKSDRGALLAALDRAVRSRGEAA